MQGGELQILRMQSRITESEKDGVQGGAGGGGYLYGMKTDGELLKGSSRKSKK